jgi:flagellar motor switch protein FliN/FliY
MFVVPLAASEGDQADIPVLLYFDGQLLTSLSSPQSARESAQADNRQIDPLNLKLVMDVELNVSLRFGQRQLPLREVLELASGSVVELDRQVDDPVELLLDGKVIARGEAVIVDGNYGLRVTEIPQPISSHFIR